MKKAKMTFEQSLIHGTRPPGVKLGKAPPSPVEEPTATRNKVVSEQRIRNRRFLPSTIDYVNAAIRTHNVTQLEFEKIKNILVAQQQRQVVTSEMAAVAMQSVLRKRTVPLSAVSGTPFPTLLVTAADTQGYPRVGVRVTFTIKAINNAYASFPDDSQVATTMTDAHGVATAPTLIAGRSIGTFFVVIAVSGEHELDQSLKTTSPNQHSASDRKPTRTPSVVEPKQMPSLQTVLTRAISRHKMTDAEGARVKFVGEGLAAKKERVMSIDDIANAIGIVLKER